MDLRIQRTVRRKPRLLTAIHTTNNTHTYRHHKSMSSHGSDSDETMERDRYGPIKKLALVQIQPPRQPNRPLTSFFISDILSNKCGGRKRAHSDSVNINNNSLNHNHHHNHNNNHNHHNHHRHIVRPWDCDSGKDSSIEDDDDEDDDDEEIDVEDIKPATSDKKSVSPLSALLQMTNKTFEGLDTKGNGDDAGKRDHLNMFAKNQPPKKRRKSRTAFTNQQIYELEKRFLYQKYLTPADRDEIAQSLGLSNAQVITWFQNRRAKLKRDLEELKNDVVHTSSSSDTLVTPLISDLDQELADVKSKNDLNPRSVESNSQTEITTEGST